jgi:transposase
MVSHFLFEAEFCNPASGWEKGQIEKNVQDARHRLWQPTPNFPTLAALNDWLETRAESCGLTRRRARKLTRWPTPGRKKRST